MGYSCFCKCKDTNFKANHNEILNYNYERIVVFANAKIQILKQITTSYQKFYKIIQLFLQMQRYKF